jgi:hypothetical protein
VAHCQAALYGLDRVGESVAGEPRHDGQIGVEVDRLDLRSEERGEGIPSYSIVYDVLR